MINIIINGTVFIPKESILYIDTEYIIGQDGKGENIKQCTVFLKSTSGGGCDGMFDFRPTQIAIPYDYIKTLKETVAMTLKGLAQDLCLEIGDKVKFFSEDETYPQEIVDWVDDFSGNVTVTCPSCTQEQYISTTHKDFPLIQCEFCLKEFTFYQTKEGGKKDEKKDVHLSVNGNEAICGEVILLASTNAVFHTSDLGLITLNSDEQFCAKCLEIRNQPSTITHARSITDFIYTLCGQKLKELSDRETWVCPDRLLNLISSDEHWNCPQCLLIAQQTL